MKILILRFMYWSLYILHRIDRNNMTDGSQKLEKDLYDETLRRGGFGKWNTL